MENNNKINDNDHDYDEDKDCLNGVCVTKDEVTELSNKINNFKQYIQMSESTSLGIMSKVLDKMSSTLKSSFTSTTTSKSKGSEKK
jgi:hypothetical protein